MSARGTITSATDVSPNLSRLASISRSCELSSLVSRSLSSMTSSRLSRIVGSWRKPFTALARRAANSLSNGLEAGWAPLRSSTVLASVEADETGPAFGSESAAGMGQFRLLSGPAYRDGHIGVGQAKSRQNKGFQRFHGLSLGGLLMVMAKQVQNPMNREMRGMSGKTLMLLTCLLADHAEGDGDVA